MEMSKGNLYLPRPDYIAHQKLSAYFWRLEKGLDGTMLEFHFLKKSPTRSHQCHAVVGKTLETVHSTHLMLGLSLSGSISLLVDRIHGLGMLIRRSKVRLLAILRRR